MKFRRSVQTAGMVFGTAWAALSFAAPHPSEAKEIPSSALVKTTNTSLPTAVKKIDNKIDKVKCPVGYMLVSGTYRVVKGQGVPVAYAQGNTLIVESSPHATFQGIAVCARLPL